MKIKIFIILFLVLRIHCSKSMESSVKQDDIKELNSDPSYPATSLTLELPDKSLIKLPPSIILLSQTLLDMKESTEDDFTETLEIDYFKKFRAEQVTKFFHFLLSYPTKLALTQELITLFHKDKVSVEELCTYIQISSFLDIKTFTESLANIIAYRIKKASSTLLRFEMAERINSLLPEQLSNLISLYIKLTTLERVQLFKVSQQPFQLVDTGIFSKQATISENGKIVCFIDDNKIKIWDALKGKALKEWPAEIYPNSPLALNKKGTLLATVEKDSSFIQLWNVQTGELFKKIEGPLPISVVSLMKQHSMEHYPISNLYPITSLFFNNNSNVLATTRGSPVHNSSHFKDIYLIDIINAKIINTLHNTLGSFLPLLFKILASESDPVNNNILMSFNKKFKDLEVNSADKNPPLSSVAFNGSKNIFIISKSFILNICHYLNTNNVKTHHFKLTQPYSVSTYALFSNDNTIGFAGGDNEIKIVNPLNPSILQTLYVERDSITNIAFNTSTHSIIALSRRGIIYVWKIADIPISWPLLPVVSLWSYSKELKNSKNLNWTEHPLLLNYMQKFPAHLRLHLNIPSSQAMVDHFNTTLLPLSLILPDGSLVTATEEIFYLSPTLKDLIETHPVTDNHRLPSLPNIPSIPHVTNSQIKNFFYFFLTNYKNIFSPTLLNALTSTLWLEDLCAFIIISDYLNLKILKEALALNIYQHIIEIPSLEGRSNKARYISNILSSAELEHFIGLSLLKGVPKNIIGNLEQLTQSLTLLEIIILLSYSEIYQNDHEFRWEKYPDLLMYCEQLPQEIQQELNIPQQQGTKRKREDT